MVFHDIEGKMTASSGSVSVNTERMRGVVKQVYVKALTADTAFDFSFTDPKGRSAPKAYTDEVGTLRDFEEMPVRGIYTLGIANATRDEEFDYLIRVQEIL